MFHTQLASRYISYRLKRTSTVDPNPVSRCSVEATRQDQQRNEVILIGQEFAD